MVLVTDGQVGNEDQILASTSSALAGIRVHTVGIDQAVNAGFLGRLAAAGGGRCELVESEDRLDAAMDHIHRRIGAPVVSGLTLHTEGLEVVADTVAPARLPDLFPGAPLVVTGRYHESRGAAGVKVTGRTRPGDEWSVQVPAATVADDSITAVWARAHLRDLEDRYVSEPYGGGQAEMERRIVATSERFGVLCRFTAWVAIDERVVTEGGEKHRVVQPVELPAGWQMPAPAPTMMLAGMARPFAAAPDRPLAMDLSQDAYLPPPRSVKMSRKDKRSLKDRLRGPAAAESAPYEEALVEAPVPPAVRELAASEAERLRAAAQAPEYERRELLADLGTRLEALTRDLGATAEATAVRDLTSELTDDHLAGLSGDTLAQLWDRVLQILDHLAAETPEGGKGDTTGAFWKRR